MATASSDISIVGLHKRGEQFDLAAEMRVDERFRDAQFGGDVVECGAGEASFVEEFDGLFQDSLTLVGKNFIAHGRHITPNGLD